MQERPSERHGWSLQSTPYVPYVAAERIIRRTPGCAAHAHHLTNRAAL